MTQSFRFDARPLTDPVDPAAVRAFAAEMKARRPTGSAGTIISIVVGVLGALVAIPVLVFALVGVVSSGMHPASLLPLILIVGAGLLFGGVGWFAHRAERMTRFRLSRFAAANHMTYEDRIDAPPLPGMIFQIGNARQSRMLVRGSSPRFVEFGNYQYTVKQGKNSTTHRWGYVAVKLDTPLPNIVLDAVGNNGFGSNLPKSFDRAQRLSLEGDFDRFFTLYCPQGYERDALYLFTPDIMARFIDSAAELDVEIVDDWLFLYTRREVSTLDAATWAWLFGAVGALITKFDQWARWRDERLRPDPRSAPAAAGALPFAVPADPISPPRGVAAAGRRLKPQTSGLWIFAAVVIIAVVVWLNIS